VGDKSQELRRVIDSLSSGEGSFNLDALLHHEVEELLLLLVGLGLVVVNQQRLDDLCVSSLDDLHAVDLSDWLAVRAQLHRSRLSVALLLALAPCVGVQYLLVVTCIGIMALPVYLLRLVLPE
jgi:hypothetical protein